MTDQNHLLNLWKTTLGDDGGNGWSTLSGGATYRAPGDEGGTLSGGSTLGGTLSGGSTMGGAEGVPTTRIGLGGFELVEEIGRGGMGVVWKARQASLARDVAVKLIRTEAANEKSRRGFVSEALVNGVLDHPNIVPVHELGSTPDGEAFLAMKLVGGTAWDRLLHPKTSAEQTRAKTFDLDKHLGVLESVANAVAFAHSRGIVHRDLKPENVMVGEYGEVLVMDWGIAVDIREKPDPADSRATPKSAIRGPAGTPSYMAPELAEGRGADIGPWTDVYLLGAILCEILRGTPPHQGNSLMAILLAASRSEPPTFPTGTPEGLIAICRTALAKDHRARYATVPALQAALAEYRKHRESDLVAASARKALERCAGRDASALSGSDRASLYGDYAEAVAGYRQALSLWSENATARQGEADARRGYALAALGAGDLALAEAQSAPLGDTSLTQRIAAATQARAAREAAAKRNRLLLMGSAAVIVVGLTVGVLLVNAQRSRAVQAEQEAVAQRDAAVTAEQKAEQRRVEAERADWKSRNLAASTLAKDQSPLPQAEAALGLAVARQVHPDTAPEGAASGRSVAHDAWLRFAYAERTSTKPVWDVAVGAPVREIHAATDAVVVVPDKGPVSVLSKEDGSLRFVLPGIDGVDIGPESGYLQAGEGQVSVCIGERFRAFSLVDGTMVVDLSDQAFAGALASLSPAGNQIVRFTEDGLALLGLDGTVQRSADLHGLLSGDQQITWDQLGFLYLTPYALALDHGFEEGTCSISALLGARYSIDSIWAQASPVEQPVLVHWDGNEGVDYTVENGDWTVVYAKYGTRTSSRYGRAAVIPGASLHHRDGLIIDSWRVAVDGPRCWDRFAETSTVVVATEAQRVSCWELGPPDPEVRTLTAAERLTGFGVEVSRDGKHLICREYDDTTPVIRSAVLSDGRPGGTITGGNAYKDGAIAADGTWIAAIIANEIQNKAEQEMSLQENGGFAEHGPQVHIAVGSAEATILALPEGVVPVCLDAGPAGDLLIGTNRGILRLQKGAGGLTVAATRDLGEVRDLTWSHDGRQAAALLVDGSVVIVTAPALTEVRRQAAVTGRVGLAWGVDGVLHLMEASGWLTTLAVDGSQVRRLRIPEEAVGPLQAFRGGEVLLVKEVLINPRDGAILRRSLRGGLLPDASATLALEASWADEKGSTQLLTQALIPPGIPADLPPLSGREKDWDGWQSQLDFGLATDGPYAGEVVPAILLRP